MTTTAQPEPIAPRARTPEAIELPLGLLGFERIKKYLLVANPEEQPFMWLEMADGPRHSFLVVPPSSVVTDYQPELCDEDVSFLDLRSPGDALVVNIVTLRNGGQSTVNLKGPIVLNRRTRVGKQVIPLNVSRYPLQHPLPAAE